MAMSNPPGVSVSQIATQVEAFDQMWIELVSFPDMADGDLSACVPWQRGMGGHFYHCANRLLRNYQDIPREGGACFNPARRNAETALAAAAPLGRKSSFFGDLPTQDAISGYLDNSGVSHQLQGEELSVGSGGGICTHRDSTMSTGHPTHMDKPYRSYITDETVKVRA
jgi:hypothetical protein